MSPLAPDRARPAARVRSWLGDWVVVAGWLAVLTLLSFFLRDSVPATVPDSPGAGVVLRYDAVAAALTVLPFFLYLVVTELGARHATLGKRWNQLTVEALGGGPPSTRSIWVRNLVKVLPWQIAHLGVSRAILDTQLPFAVVANIVSLVLLAVVAVPALTGGQGLHDRLAGTRVVPAAALTGQRGEPR